MHANQPTTPRRIAIFRTTRVKAGRVGSMAGLIEIARNQARNRARSFDSRLIRLM
jgi:hypothetical protein